MPASSPVSPAFPPAPSDAEKLPEQPVFSARLGPDGNVFEAPASLTLLQAAEQADIKLETSCRNGTCRHCLRQLISGQVRYRIEWPGVSLDEKRENFILPCVAYPASDVVIALAP